MQTPCIVPPGKSFSGVKIYFRSKNVRKRIFPSKNDFPNSSRCLFDYYLQMTQMTDEQERVPQHDYGTRMLAPPHKISSPEELAQKGVVAFGGLSEAEYRGLVGVQNPLNPQQD